MSTPVTKEPVGVTAGMLVRRTVPAMALTLVAVVGTQVALPLFVQPNLLAPSTATVTISRDTLDGVTAGGDPRQGGPSVLQRVQVNLDKPGAWLLSQETVDAAGDAVTSFPEWTGECFGNGPANFETCFDRLAAEGYRQRVEYLPASKFWALQAAESALVLAVAAALVGFCFWRVRRDF